MSTHQVHRSHIRNSICKLCSSDVVCSNEMRGQHLANHHDIRLSELRHERYYFRAPFADE